MAASWRERFAATFVTFPSWSVRRPDTLFYVSDDDGTVQAWSFDLATGDRHQLTRQDVGVESVVVLPDGRGVAWWADDSGDENGAWMVTSVDGARTSRLVPALPPGWAQGLSLVDDVVALGLADDDGYRVHVVVGDAPPRQVFSSTQPAGIGREWETTAGGLCADGSLLCIRHSDDGDILHFALRVIDVATGETAGEQRDSGLTLKVAAWSPRPGDHRLAIVHERDGIERPAIWDLASGTRRDYPVDLPGPVDVAGWWPDGSGLLLLHHWHGRRTLHRLDVDSGEVALVHDPQGWVSGAGVRPDGTVWLRDESATRPPRVRTLDGDVVLAPLGPVQPAGRPHTSFVVDGEAGPIHVLLTVPDGPPPYPTVVMVHGGPEWAYPDDLDAWAQALTDEGYAVVKPNYRGSTGSTVAWRTALHGGNIGLPEVADVVATLDHLVAEGISDPGRVAIEGWSWGGYVALLAAGLHPDRWAAVIGGIPVCDSVMTHEDCSPPQRAYDVAIMGGTPAQLPDLYAERSPSTYVDRVSAPVLLIAGEHDSACPIRQVRHYAGLLEARGADVTTHVYAAGHHANSSAEQLAHAELELAFLARHLASPQIHE